MHSAADEFQAGTCLFIVVQWSVNWRYLVAETFRENYTLKNGTHAFSIKPLISH